MKAKELANLLMSKPELDVVVDIHNHCSDFCAHAVIGIDLGWEPSGVLSIRINDEADTA